jgi:hypothetical protein
MRTKPDNLKELQLQIIELKVRKETQESELRTSVHTLAESLKPENILLRIAGKFVSKWFRTSGGSEEKRSDLKDSVLETAKRFASETIAKGIDLLAQKIFS